MKKLITKYLLFAGIILFSLKGMSQQDPLFTQYMYNMSVVNPAYATDDPGMLNMGAIYRAQWVDVDGAPRTLNFFAHTPVSERVELGLTVVHDEIGDWVKENNITADFAYVIPASENTKLSFGAKAGLSTFNANLNGVILNDPNDPAFEDQSEIFPVFGVGMFWFGDHHYLGVSAPNLFTSKHIENNASGLQRLGVEEVHYYLTGGYVFGISDNFKLKPSFMMRGVQGAPLSVDVNANVLLYDKLEAGVGYRFDKSVTGLLNFRVSPSLRIGYAYDYPTYDLSQDGSHEIMILFDLDMFGLKKGYDKSPRFF